MSGFHDIIDTALRYHRLMASAEHCECIARTMTALMPDTGAAIEAARRLIQFYGMPAWLASVP